MAKFKVMVTTTIQTSTVLDENNYPGMSRQEIIDKLLEVARQESLSELFTVLALKAEILPDLSAEYANDVPTC